ncbi:MAG: bifunctional serine/threonine-protein kinase/formylglycine-generating enzyme family protein [Planctomycetota bacterium]|nr:bifunctional serine/threonine-protein kinase/formylglycine-generating enzyme family protein [Planctomycetota bacterium]
MPVALETFLSQLLESGILSDQKLRAAEYKKSEHQDGESLAKDMVKSGHLTKYQAEQILSGKGKNLCMGQYVLQEKLGAGGMGQVYKAYHSGMERLVAIKVILGKGNTDTETVKRFEREIKAAAKLAHPNIITVYDAGNADGRHFMVMELVKGQDLSEIISQKGVFGTRDTVDYITQAAKGLKFAHANGVIHRDIKPGNLILDSDGVLKIVDMGLAKIHSKENDETLSMLTGNAAIMGTVDFMSPEQSLSTKNVDGRADIYSLGATLYYMLTGNVMYPGKTAMVKLMAHRKSLIPSLRASRPDISENLDAVYSKMVAKDLNDRYQNMSELISDLELVANGFAPIVKPKEMVTINSLQNDFGGFQIKVKGTNLKLGKSTINFKGFLSNKKLLGIIGGTLTGAFLMIFFFMIGIFGGGKKEEFKKTDQISSINKTPDTKSDVATIPKGNNAPSINTEKKSAQSVFLTSPFSESMAKEAQSTLAKSLNLPAEEKVNLGNGVSLDMVLIPAGKFMMGSPASEVNRYPNETQHEVTLTTPFYVGKYEVTQDQWQTVMGSNPSIRTKGAKLPVTDVSWNDCQDFIKNLNAKTNDGYRLPSEAEWEYACRAGTSTAYSVGGSLTNSDANIAGSSIKTVGSYMPNAFGLYDMHGNVWELCEDWYRNYPAGEATDPKGPEIGTNRVLRGGSFVFDGSIARSSFRADQTPPNRSYPSNGFRLARTVDFKTAVAHKEPKPDIAAVMPTSGNLLVSPFREANAKEVQKAVAKSLQKEVEEKVNLGYGVSLDMVLIPAGKFIMGSPTTEVGRNNDETQHEVIITKAFYIGKYELTQEQWEVIMESNPSIRTKGAKLPVTDVSWNDCQNFLKKLNTKTNGGYRLPTEVEWEYTCRAGTNTVYSFGDNLLKSDANYGVNFTGSIKTIGSYNANAFGLYDMHGNVWEWCEDRYGDYLTSAVIDPKVLATGDRRVLRGGCYASDVSGARSSVRGSSKPTNSPNGGGFHNCGVRFVRTTYP